MQIDNYLKQLIEIPSICGDFSASREVIQLYEAFLQKYNFSITNFTESDFPSLVATTQNTKTPQVYLVAHLDVVPGPQELFSLRRDEKNYYGRGVFDMKFAAAAYMHTVDILAEKLSEYDFGIMLTTDEELYGPYGVGMLARKGYLPKKACLLPDGASHWNIETYAKGRWFFEISVPGISSHGSRPWEGDSASIKMVRLLSRITDLFTSLQQPETATMNIGTIQSGTTVNQTPHSAVAAIDLRYTTTQELERLKAAIETICADYNASIMSLSDVAIPVKNDLDNQYIASFADSIHEVTGVVPQAISSFATSDARFFMPYNIPVIVMSPPGGNRHSDTEWLEVKGYEQLPAVIASYLEKEAKIR